VELDAARKETDESNTADNTLQESEKEAAALRAKADEIIDQVTAELGTFLRKLTPAQKRRKMRLYGVTCEPEDPPVSQPEPVVSVNKVLGWRVVETGIGCVVGPGFDKNYMDCRAE
jgi:hypothetical protein